MAIFLFFRCFVDCGAVVPASNKFRVTSECLNSACNGSAYEWRLRKLNRNTNMWENVTILPNMTSTGVNSNNMIITKNSLPSGSTFSLMLVVQSSVGSEGFGLLDFATAGEPYGGDCSPSAEKGIALKTEFTFECSGWQDQNSPLTYEFRAGKDVISYGNSAISASTVLPAGLQEHDYRLTINVVIKNSVRVAVIKSLSIKVSLIATNKLFVPCQQRQDC